MVKAGLFLGHWIASSTDEIAFLKNGVAGSIPIHIGRNDPEMEDIWIKIKGFLNERLREIAKVKNRNFELLLAMNDTNGKFVRNGKIYKEEAEFLFLYEDQALELGYATRVVNSVEELSALIVSKNKS